MSDVFTEARTLRWLFADALSAKLRLEETKLQRLEGEKPEASDSAGIETREREMKDQEQRVQFLQARIGLLSNGHQRPESA